MFDGETNFQYNEYSISDILTEQAPAPPKFSTHNDFTVYVMGPYTAFNAEVAYDDANKLRTPFQNDPLFDPDRHITNDDKGDMEQGPSGLLYGPPREPQLSRIHRYRYRYPDTRTSRETERSP